jgi:hypothetical protein
MVNRADNKTFEITSGIMVASDPCYTLDPPTWCMGVIENVKKGTWLAEIETSDEGAWGERIARLRIEHINANRTYQMQQVDMDGGVDSGQFGFFDKNFYRNDEASKDLKKYDFGRDVQEKESGEEWYRACCELTLAKESWGVLPQGVVSSSGFGDGSYPVFGEKDENGEWVVFEVVFIDEEEDEWDENEEDEWGENQEENEEEV